MPPSIEKWKWAAQRLRKDRRGEQGEQGCLGEKSKVPEQQQAPWGEQLPSSPGSPAQVSWGKAGGRSKFSPHFVFPSKMQRAFKVALQPRIPRGSLSFLHSESPLSKEIKMSFKKLFIVQITVIFCPSTVCVPDAASTGTRILQLRNEDLWA